MIEIRNAQKEEYEIIRQFYHSLIDDMKNSKFYIGWEKDIYPSPDFLMSSINNNELFVGLLQGDIVSSMIVNHQWNEGYDKFVWKIKTSADSVTVIHALGVNPKMSGKGIAKEMVKFVLDTARKNGQKAVRLDVLKGNTPAQKLYLSKGFQYLDTLQMYYEDTGLTDYELYEYVVS